MDSKSQMKVRLPADARNWVERQAERDASSMNSVIVRAVRERMAREAAAQRDAQAA